VDGHGFIIAQPDVGGRDQTLRMRRVAVTGGAAGLGRVVVALLESRGYDVIVVDRDDGVVADLSDLDEVRRVAGLLERAGVDGLVNNAGSWSPGAQYPDGDGWLASMTLDLLTPMLLTQLLWPRLEAVVNVGSSGGEGAEAYGSPEYAAAKAGLRRLTSSLADRPDVRVTAVVPGWIGLERANRQRAEMSERERQQAGPLVAPDEVAAAVVRLLEAGEPGKVVELL
jgi:NAD(P)-dependent dehydrogenase (short-subunit alcohol dehydrogenase family)